MILNNSYTEQDFSRFDSKRAIENRELRIFLSSTFIDMNEEREALVKTFDSLRLEANRRNVSLSVVDLRWGITEEDMRSGKMLSVCLEETEHSHPFFIGLLGSRYGTSPDISELEKNPELEERYPWLRKDIEHRLSTTEIEMQYGVLRNPYDVDAAFFIKNVQDIQTNENEKLTWLKKQIWKQDRFAKEEYTSIEDLCKKVEIAIRNMLNKHFPEEKYSRLRRERTAQKAYLNTKHNHYQRLQTDFNRLDQFLEGDETHLIITGPSGMGKSALIANWLKEKEDEKEQLPYNIIYHFVGNSFSGNDYRQILQHICDEIYNLYGLERQEGMNEELKDEVQRILVEAGQKGKPLLIVIDGVNQIIGPDKSKLLYWLPQAPQTTKYLFSTLEDDVTMEIFKRLDYSIHTIGKLDRHLREQFIIDYLHNVGKKPTQPQLNRILDDSENENMLVLKTLLDELISFGSNTQLDTRIDYYLSAASTEDFFDRMLQRMENDYSEVQRILSLIALSENGMTENELQTISRVSNLDFHLFYCVLYNHIVIRNGLISFSHQYITNAVWQRYNLADPEKAKPYRLQIISHTSINNRITRWRRISELSFQCYHTDNDEMLYKTILSFEAFRYFNATDQGKALLARYWRKLLKSSPEKYQLKAYLDLSIENIAVTNVPYNQIGEFILTYFGDSKTAMMYNQAYLSLIIDSNENDIVLAKAYYYIGWTYHEQGDNDNALENCIKALQIREKVLGTDHPDTADSYNDTGIVYNAKGDYDKALEFSIKALEIRKKILGVKHLSTAMSYDNTGTVYNSKGDYHKALEYHFEALKIRLNILGTMHPLIAMSYNNIGLIYGELGNFKTALECHFKAMAIKEQVLGTEHPDTALSYNNISTIYSELKDYDKALEFLFKSLKINLKVMDSKHPTIATTFMNIGTIYSSKGDYDKALEYHFKALEIDKEVLGREHPNIANTYNSIGCDYKERGEDGKALEYLLKAIDISEHILGTSHPATATSYFNIGCVYEKQYDYHKALEYHLKALDIFKKSFGVYHYKTAISYNSISDIYMKDGNYDKALEYSSKALDIREKVLGSMHAETAYSYNNIGLVFFNLHNYDKALTYYLKALKILEQIKGIEHPDTAMTYINIGSVFTRLGEYDKAEEYYFKALDILERTLGTFHTDTAMSYSNISSIYQKKGDYDKALEYYFKALDILEQILGAGHPETAVHYCNIGTIYCDKGDYDKALQFCHKGLEICEKTFGTDHKNTHIIQSLVELVNQKKLNQSYQQDSYETDSSYYYYIDS